MNQTAQSGFTLIELMLVVFLSAMLLTIGIIFTYTTFQSDLSAVERENLESRRSVLYESLQSDLDSAGSGFVRVSERFFSGSEYLSFAVHPDFEVLDGNIYRRNYSTEEFLRASSVLTSSTGRFEFTAASPREIIVELVGDQAGDARRLWVSGEKWCVIEEERCLADQTSEAGNAQDGDSYSIQLDNDLANGGRIFTYFRLRDRERTLLYRSLIPATSSNYLFQIPQMATGDYLSQVRGTGVFQAVGEAVADQLQETLLPMCGNDRCADYVQKTTDDEGFSILRGESETDFLRLTRPVDFESSQAPVEIFSENLRRGDYKTGDYALLADYKNKKSVVLLLTEQFDASNGYFVFLPVGETSAHHAFDWLWSQSDDYLGHQFQPSHSRLIKLAPPVFYRIVMAGELRQLERRLAFGSWDLVELSIKSLNFDIARDGSQRPFYRVRAEIYGEGIESAVTVDQIPPVREINFTVNPRSFNQTGSQSE